MAKARLEISKRIPRYYILGDKTCKIQLDFGQFQTLTLIFPVRIDISKIRKISIDRNPFGVGLRRKKFGGPLTTKGQGSWFGCAMQCMAIIIIMHENYYRGI